jgi:hypothetical protein
LGKFIQPGFDRFKRQFLLPMLIGINITVPAVEVALGEDVKKKIGGIF